MTTYTDLLGEKLQDTSFVKLYGEGLAKDRLGIAFYKARQSSGTTKEALSKVFGVAVEYISRMESGEVNPSISKVGAMFAYMGYSLDFVLEPLIKSSSKE